MDTTEVTAEVTSTIGEHIPETLLLVGGLIALLIVITYVKNKESLKYKFMMAIGLVFGVLMAIEALKCYGEWRMVTSLFVLVAAFALIIRPFRDVHFAVILALLVMAVVYLMMGGLDGYMLFDSIDLTFLSEGWPRLIVSFLAGAFVYGIFNFAEEIVKLFGKILNWWPLLFVFGLLCMVEAMFMLMGYGSIVDYIDTSSISV